MKIIQLEKEYNAEHLLGKFLEDDAYDIVLNEDADVYRPLKIGEEQDETTILLKFRKNVFTKEQCDAAYEGLKSGATLTDNRGIAAGASRTGTFQKYPNGREGARRWVTKREKAVLEYFADSSPPSLYGDRAWEIYEQTPNIPLEGRGGGVIADSVCIKGGSIWIVKTVHEIDFDKWFRETVKLSPSERKTKAIALVEKYISDTTYGESVNSGVGGFMDRYPRIPFCRQTAWTSANIDNFRMAYSLFERASQIYSENFPIRWKGQNEAFNKLDPELRIPNTVYTTITINKSFRTACHRDAGDLCDPGTVPNPRGFSNLTVVTNGKSFDGFYLCFPEFRVAANVQAGDFIMMDAHRIHGNTPVKTFEDGFERLSLVLYFREAMLDCGSAKYEELRKNFVYSRKSNKDHPEWKPGWNGISAGLFESKEWNNYLRMNGYD